MGMKGVIMFVLIFVFLCQLIRTDAQSSLTYIYTHCVGDNFNYTKNSIYQQNLNLLMSNLPPQASTIRFYNSTIGNGLNKVYGIFQCRQDLSVDVCSACIKEVTRYILVDCPLAGEAVIWYDECTLRYSNRNIFSLMEVYPSYSTWSSTNVSDAKTFWSVLGPTMDDVMTAAAAGSGPTGHFAVRQSNLSSYQKVYCLAQCNPDISTFYCNNCLRYAFNVIDSTNCDGVTVYLPSCLLSYDLSPFYNVTTPAPSPPNLVTPGPGPDPAPGPKSKPVAVIAGASAVGVVLLCAGIWVYMCRKKSKEPNELLLFIPVKASHESHDHNLNEITIPESMQFSFNTIQVATNDFSSNNKLGQGGFGPVYKGTLPNGQEIAVKRLSVKSRQGAEEFKTEAVLLVKLQHKKLVRLLGFCIEGEERLLVYELMSNSSLDKFLFNPEKRVLLDWPTRYKIITGIARGLKYLHEDSRLTIIHRDLKCGNILLDKFMESKISDFGTAKLFGVDQIHANTNRIVGTYGYMAPEYAMHGNFSIKSDIFSFGVIILEIVTGQSSNFLLSKSEFSLPRRVWTLWNGDDKGLSMVDATLGNNYHLEEVIKCIHIGLLCVQEEAAKRPTMLKILHALNEDNSSASLPQPASPDQLQFLMSNEMGIAQFSYGSGSSPNPVNGSTIFSKSATTEISELYPR